MGNKSSPELTLSFLLMAAVCLEAFIIEKKYHYAPANMTWTEARLYCQNNHIDLVTLNTGEESWLAGWLMEYNGKQVWIGLLRDPEDDSVWKWINLKTGKGITGYNVSQSINWTDGQPIRHCALMADKDLKWRSVGCSSEHSFYCSVGDIIQHHTAVQSWYDALHSCQALYGDLATITQTTTNTHNIKKKGWIGLYREGGETWSWTGDLLSEYRNWAPGEPLNSDCASFDPATAKYHSHACSKKLSALCYDDNLVVVNENKTWEDALNHCQDMKTLCVDPSGPCVYRHKLLSLDGTSDYNYVRERIYKAMTDEVWLGLRLLGGQWWWISGIKLKDHEVLPACPTKWKNCGTLSKYDTNQWIIRDCSERRNFICVGLKILIAA